MMTDVESMRVHWMESSLVEVNDTLLLTPEWESREGLMLIRQTMADVVRSQEPLFWKPIRSRKERRGLVATKVGRLLEQCLGVDVCRIRESFPQCSFDPYFELFANAYRASPLWSREYLRCDADQLNAFVAELRTKAKRDGLKETLDNHARGTLKNGKVVASYIRALYEDYPKILHVRVDFYYGVAWLRRGLPAVSAEEMKSHRQKLMRYVRKKYGAAALGHIWTVELGEMKGPHFHVFLHFDGQKVREGITIARHLGEHWQHVVTEGRGAYWNINLQEARYEAEGRRGIGLISHADERRRRNLLNSALYLVKADLYVRVRMPGFVKTFGHGRLRPRMKGKAGRKRKGYRLQAGIEAICTRRGGVRRR